MDSEDADVGGDFFVLQDVNMTLANVLRRHFGYSGGLRNFTYEHQSSQNHARLHGDSQIGKDRKQKGHQPCPNLEPR